MHLYTITGRSSTGKDSIYARLLKMIPDKLIGIATYTTRPMRPGEVEGEQYFFKNNEQYEFLKKSGRIIEERSYDTGFNVWHYFTVDDEQFRNVPEGKSILIVCSLVQVKNYQDYFGRENVTPLYIDIDDVTLMERSLKREKAKEVPNVRELCRRFISDKEEYTDELKAEVGVDIVFKNDGLIEDVLAEIVEYISETEKKRSQHIDIA